MYFTTAALLAAVPALAAAIDSSVATVKTVSGWTSVGCWTDGTYGQRVLPNSLQGGYTPEGCLSACAAKGYTVCGLEYGGECWGAPGFPRYTSKAADVKCSMKCKNDNGSICGGNGFLTLYAQPSVFPSLPNEAFSTYKGYTYDACYADNVSGHTLSQQLFGTGGTVTGCLDACAAKGATACGVSYYGECWADKNGAGLNPAAGVISEEKCKWSCKNAPAQSCGGQNALNVWKLDAVPSEVQVA